LHRGKWSIRLAAALLALLGPACAAFAQGEPFIPSFWDPNRRPAKPDTSAIHLIRFVTADDYPPFNFAQADGSLAGFNVDLARAICDELQIACTIQARRWDTLPAALDDNKGDALIASVAVNAKTREKIDFTAPYFILPGRFAIRVGKAPAPGATPEKMGATKVAVAAGSAHEAWLKAYFPKLELKPFEDMDAARAALIKGDVEAVFGDAVSLTLWMNGAASKGCCVFFGGPFIDAEYFGEGLAIGVRKDNSTLRRALDYALARLAEKGAYSELYLKYFPIGAF
jgi:polar amino acid transport system substrate-binding protein